MIINDLVSIIIPVYNASKYLAETIESINKQTYQNYEAIFIDDGSNDNSVEIIEKYKSHNSRMKIIKLEHIGVSEARNIGIKNAKGRFLTFLDSDDIWFKDKLEKQVKFIKENDYAFVYCNFKYISDDGKKVSKEIKAGRKTDYNRGLQDIRILTITAMIDLNKVPKELCYMPNVMNEDVVTWWQILKNGYTAYGQDEVLAYYRKTKNSRSSKKHITAYYRLKLYRNQENLKLGKALYCFFKYVLNAILKRTGGMKKFVNKDEELQVLISTQNLQNDVQVDKLLKNMNVTSNYLIVNQTMNNKCNIENSNVITKFEKGLSKSRNTAIQNSNADIILLADDDMVYENDYEEKILRAYKNNPEADMIAFYVKSRNSERRVRNLISGKIGWIRIFRVSSFQLSFRKNSIKGLKFDENFGTGTKNFCGEETIFLSDCLRKGLKLIYVDEKIGEVEQKESSWYKGVNKELILVEKECFKRIAPKIWWLLWVQYIIRKW